MDTEHASPARVEVTDERAGQQWRPMTDDEHVVRLFERHGRFDDQAAHPGSAVVAQVPVQLLDPGIRSEHQGDFRLAGAHGCAESEPSGAAPVARTSVMVPVSIAEAIRAAAAESTAIVTLASSDSCSGPLSWLRKSRTSTLLAT